MEKKTKMLLLEFVFLIIACSVYSRVILSFVWVIFHEFSHIIVSKIYGLNVYNVQLNITGAKAEIENIDDIKDNKKIILYFAGPLFNMFAALVLLAVKNYYGGPFIDESIEINLALAIFNLLPVYPLDGVRVYELLLSKKIIYKRTKKIFSIISYIFSGIFIFLFFIGIFIIHKANWSLIFASIFIIYTTYYEKKNTMYILMGDLIKKRRRIIEQDYLENKVISVYYKKRMINLLTMIDRNKFNSFYILDDDLRLLKTINEDEVIETLKTYGDITIEEYIKNIKSQ